MNKQVKDIVEPTKISIKDEAVILNTFKNNYDSAKHYTNAWVQRMDKWKREYFGLPYGNEVEGRSKIVSKEIKKYSEWLQSSILDPFISTPDIIRCNPTNPESIECAKQAEILLNTQFCRQFDRFNFLSKALKILDLEGTCILKTGWEVCEEERDMLYITPQIMPDPNNPTQPLLDENGNPVIQEKKEIKKEKVYLVNRPSVMICRNRDIFIDPTCLGDFNKAQFIIHRWETDLSTLKVDGRYKNLDKIQFSSDPEYINKTNTFVFSDKARRKIVVYEYWGNYDLDGDGIVEPIVCTWVGNVIIRFDRNPYPDKKPPFIITPLLPIPFELYGVSNAEVLGDIQKIKTATIRGIIDNMANSNNAQIGIQTGALDPINRDRMLKGENFVFNGSPNDFFVGNYNQLPSSIFNFLQLLDAEAQSLTGINTWGNSQTTNLIGESNASSRGVLDGGNLRKLMIVKSISENLIKPLLRKWLEYDAAFLEKETLIRVTGTNFEVVRRDDLYGSIDLDLSISTNEDNAVKARELAFLLQTIGPNEDPEIRKILMVEIANLHKMPELAYRLATYQPQPDPMTVAMQQAQIENLQAQTQELQASAGRQVADTYYKESKIPTEQAKAKQLAGKADLDNLSYYQKQQRLDALDQKEKEDKDRESKEKIERAKQQAKIFSELLRNQDNANRDKKNPAKTDYSPSIAPPSNRNPYNPQSTPDVF